ncbi:MAG: TonB-dependent receptor [Bacteroidetes bacterium]|nr:TonB-dependent receptor [Bacteroidota bacterium]
MKSHLLFAVCFLFFLSFFVTSSKVQAQTGVIRGFVYETETGEPVIFTNVYLFKTSLGAATDVNGYFSIGKVPAGQYLLMVSYMGFDTLQIPITVKSNDLITKKLYLKKSSVMLGEFSISAAREDKKVETQTSIIKITPKEIGQIPSIGGQPDLAQYLQVLPGVIFSGDQGGQLYIRGGPPIQNKVLLDGMELYQAFHSIGLFSVFDVDIIKNVDVMTGGFNAEYGGRLSSVMNITTRDGNHNRFAGKIDVSTFGAKVLLEGPLARAKSEDASGASFILSVKNSYLAESSKIFYKYIDENGLPYNYLDIYGKISINAANGSKVNLYGFDFTDKVQYQILQNYKWNSYGGGTNFIVIPGGSPVLLEGNFAYSQYKVTLEQDNFSPRSSSIAGFSGGFHFTYFFGKNALKYGIDLSGYKTTLSFYNSVNRAIVLEQNTTDPSVYVKYKWLVGKFIFEPGLRLQYYASLGAASIEPRLAIKYNVTDKFRLKMAAGIYSQNLVSTTYDRDVVNLFYGFIAGPNNLPETFNGHAVTSKYQKCDQVILGFEADLYRNLTLNVEGYYKYYPQLTNLNRNKLYEDTPENADKPDYLKKDFIIETGDAEGVDVSLRYDYKNLHFWGVYSLCFIHRFDGQTWYVPVYDRRHNVNLTASYIFGKHQGWEVDLRWNYGSGFPFTQTGGFYEQINFNDIGTSIINQNGTLGTIYADYNKGRLPYYSRLDFNIKKKFDLGRYTKLEINASVTNMLNQQNIFYFDRVSYQRVDQLPLMPSLGISFTF